MIATHSQQRTDLYPLSSSQARIWFMEKLDKEITAYNIPLDLKITGDLDIDRLQRSIDILTGRHPSFRTIFPNGNGAPSQKVLSSMSVPVRIVHLEEEPEEEKTLIISRHSLDNATRIFDLENGPLLYFELLVLGNREYLLLACFHHIISDATSVRIFLEELKAVYRSLSENTTVLLPDLPATYVDYTRWEKEWTHTADYKRQLEYWRNELTGAPEMLQLPTDHRRPKMQSYRGNEFHFVIDGALRDRILALGKLHGTGLFVPLMTAFAVLLSRYSSQPDLVIGVPVANRTREEFESLVGVLINSLPLRVTFSDDISFSTALKRVKEKFLAAFENQEVAFERLVDELKVKRNMGSSPLFQVLFNYLTGYRDEIDLPGCRAKMVPGERRASQTDLTLTISDQQTELACIIEYNTDLFRSDTIERMSGHLRSILETGTQKPDLGIQEIPLFSEAEQQLMLGSWNETQVAYPANLCTHHVFEEQVRKTPDAIAVADDHSQLTYAELNARANKLAHFLVKKGAAEDTFVAVYLDRTLDLIIGLLAASKTGATYLPLDPIFPRERIRMILEDASPVLILTQKSLMEDLPQTTLEILLADEPALYADESDENLSFGNPQKAAYILFTSGSTGKPKGVLVKHHSTVNVVRAITKLMSVTANDILLSATTFTFDVAEMEMYLPLFNGAKLVIASQETAVNIDLLKDKLNASGATLFLATPVTFKMLVLTGWEGKQDLRVLCGGEALPKELAAEMVRRCKLVLNGYAPTETTIYSLIKKVRTGDTEGEGYVALGHPIDNTILYVLNAKRIPVPVGIPGELYIGGEGVSAGYLHLPEQNAERFITDPLGRNPGMKFYKSGDLVVRTLSGEVHFLNRIDFQIKIRGFRIELGEIESAIGSFPDIREKVVVVKADPSGEKMLAAYYVTAGETDIHLPDLHTYLKERLPDYMIPSAFVRMEQFPLTSTLKIDRNALPEPDAFVSASTVTFSAPSTPIEKKMAAIWSSLLGIKKIGINDDFFEIGGHSMIAVALMVKIEKEFGIRIPLASLFEHSTVFHLSQLVQQGSGAIEWRSLVPIRPQGTKKPLFLVHGMGLNVLLYTTVVNYLDPDQPVYGLQAKGLNGSEEPLDSIEEIAAYYISEVLTVDPDGPYAMAGFSLGGRIAFEMARQLTEMGKQVQFLGLFDAMAEESYAHLPLAERTRKFFIHHYKYLSWNISAFFQIKNESRMAMIRRRWKGLEKKLTGLDFKLNKEDLVSYGNRSELPKYLRKVHRANARADRNYVIRPYSGSVHLFKAKKQTFYIEDPVHYGWDKAATGGVFIHEVPGEHSNTFAPPNDRHFANLLQKQLNQISFH